MEKKPCKFCEDLTSFHEIMLQSFGFGLIDAGADLEL